MSTRQSRLLLVNAAVHVYVREQILANVPPGKEADPSAINDLLRAYLQGPGDFVFEHEGRHVQQLLAYPALYLRGLREYDWGLAALSDFRQRGDIVYDPLGRNRPILDPQDPGVQFISNNYHSQLRQYPAGTNAYGRLIWGDDPRLSQLSLKRKLTEAKLIEAEALAVQYALARKRGATEAFHRWAGSNGANTTPIDDIVTVLCGPRDPKAVELAVLQTAPALVWHAFHTTWPVVAFLNFLETLSVTSDIEALATMDKDALFALVGTLRFDENFMDHCPLLDSEAVNQLATRGMPLTDKFAQLDESDSTWYALLTANPAYPLSGALQMRIPEGRWPDNMDFVDPSPSIMTQLLAGYPATAYLLTAYPNEQAAVQGFNRRWIARTPWRVGPADKFAGQLVVLEIAQTLLANVYAHVLPADAKLVGKVDHTCWHERCPVHGSGLCRFWDAIPTAYEDCEYLQLMPQVLGHQVNPTTTPPVIQKVEVSENGY